MVIFAVIPPSTEPIIDARLLLIPRVKNAKQRCMHYRMFRSGITGFGKFTADDHVALIQQLPYVIGTTSTVIRTVDVKHRKALIGAINACRIIYLTLKKRQVNEHDLNVLHAAAKSMGPLLEEAISGLPEHAQKKFNIHRPKVHALLHFR